MKFFVLVAIAFALLTCMAQAQPVSDVDPIPEDHVLVHEDAHQEVLQHSRQKRATCDLLSKWNWNHTACAGHCIAKGFKGGYCNDKAVCVCRN
nr:defensin [Drosophila melanogaster]AAO72494.1 defensin [Drosophila melanogaster]AAO72495.1 defensin [Drosophila melanogaster]AAO72496.1 defensin [Drosophila melanogaster]AAO72497.1 defensin [Drosophila melanogaster]